MAASPLGRGLGELMQPRQNSPGAPPARGVGSLLRGGADAHGGGPGVPVPEPAMAPVFAADVPVPGAVSEPAVAAPSESAPGRQPVWPFVLADLALVSMAGFLMNPGRRSMTGVEASVCFVAMLIAAWLGFLGVRAAAANQRSLRPPGSDPFKP